jgi:hypothetical protein
MIVLGYDPGGAKKSGKGQSGVGCLKDQDGQLLFHTSQCRSVADALGWFSEMCGNKAPEAIGIDTFLHWAPTEKGWRPVDVVLRKEYPAVANSILPTNSTAGSMAIQGMALAIAAKNKWPSVVLNEVHPKVLFAHFGFGPYPRGNSDSDANVRSNFLKSVGFECRGDMKCEDEFDAALCCFATVEGIKNQWCDLLELRLPAIKSDDLIFPAGKVRYLWPQRPKSID